MTAAERWDVIIVGAGPAGLSTALHLAQLSPELIPRTLLLEKAHHPRPKLCGGGLIPDAEAVLAALGLDVREVPHVDVDWGHFDYGGKGFRMRGEKKGAYAFRVIRRYEFDAWLAGKVRARGFRIQEDTAVRAIRLEGDEVVVDTAAGEFHSRVVVGADGSKGVVRRFVVPRERSHTARLLEIVTEPRPDTSFHIQTNSYFDFLYVPQGILGYSWDFPALDQGRPVRVRGIYDSNVYRPKQAIELRSALEDEVHLHGYHLEDYELEGHPMRWFEAESPFSAPHVLLAGDAAGADALFGEGISIALGYGKLAAQAIREAFKSQDFSFRSYRKTILRSQMGRSLRRRTRMAKFFYRLRSRTIQAIVWRRLGWAVEWVMQNFMIGWAKRAKSFTTTDSTDTTARNKE